MYFKGTKCRSNRYANGNLGLFGYSDNSWADDLFDKKSTTNYLFILNRGSISWASRKQPIVFTSTCKAKYIAQTEVACEAMWICGLLEELGVLETIEEDGYLKTISPPHTHFCR